MKCKNCRKNITRGSKSGLCSSCWQLGKLNSQYVDGRKNKKYYCQNCGKKLVNIYAKLCLQCYWKSIYGKNHPNWKGGKEKYKERYRERINSYHRQYNNIIENRLKHNLRTRVYYVLKGKSKSNSTMLLLDCSIEFLKEYLQNQFKLNMNWKNYGKVWEIDHIKPCDKFDLTKNSEQKKCFNYTNLQPLLARENRIKSNNMEMS